MRLKFIILLLLGSCLGAVAQNLQLHYLLERHIVNDLKGQSPLLLTLEHYKADRWGETSHFVDLYTDASTIKNAYAEISRELKFWKAPITLHLEYNGGLRKGYPLANAYLAGLSYLFSKDSGKKSFKLSSSYRYDARINGLQEEHHGMQLTACWLWTSWNRVFSFMGFMDLWTKKTSPKSNGIILVSEPQLWMNLNQIVGVSDHFNLSLGTEVRLSYNFITDNRFYCLPTLALKWTF